MFVLFRLRFVANGRWGEVRHGIVTLADAGDDSVTEASAMLTTGHVGSSVDLLRRS
jgi:hypothetical protein